MSRLTDQELEKLERLNRERINDTMVSSSYTSAWEVLQLATEMRERRQADLTAQDLEALRWMRAQAQRADAGAPTVNTQRALAVLDKLLARGVGR